MNVSNSPILNIYNERKKNNAKKFKNKLPTTKSPPFALYDHVVISF